MPSLMSSDPELQEVALNPSDVCDRHPMDSAWVRFSKVIQVDNLFGTKVPKLVELLFCKNCADKHESGMVANGWIMQDERGRLIKRESGNR
jgi:hypothetical protein